MSSPGGAIKENRASGGKAPVGKAVRSCNLARQVLEAPRAWASPVQPPLLRGTPVLTAAFGAGTEERQRGRPRSAVKAERLPLAPGPPASQSLLHPSPRSAQATLIPPTSLLSQGPESQGMPPPQSLLRLTPEEGESAENPGFCSLNPQMPHPTRVHFSLVHRLLNHTGSSCTRLSCSRPHACPQEAAT